MCMMACFMRISFLKVSHTSESFLHVPAERKVMTILSLLRKPSSLKNPCILSCLQKNRVGFVQDTATTCRERCGGQGYLSCNRFGQILGFAHAGMTAEGDNRVLMMKVAKEYLSTAHLPATKARLQAGQSSPVISGKATASKLTTT